MFKTREKLMIGKGQRIGWRDNKSERSQEALWSLIVTSFLGSKLASDAIYWFSLLLVLVHTVKGFSSMTLVFPLSARPSIPNPISITSQLFITAIPRLLSVNIMRLETLHTFHIRVMIIHRTESSHVRSCFRCTSLEKDET